MGHCEFSRTEVSAAVSSHNVRIYGEIMDSQAMSFSATKLHQIIQILLDSMGIPRPQSWLLTHACTLYFLQWWTSYRTVQRAESPVGARYTMFHIRYRAIPDAELSSASPAGGSFISEFNMSWVSLTGETVHGLEARDKGRDLLLWQSSHIRLMTRGWVTG